MGLHIQSSKGKHESEIPQFELSAIFELFQERRAEAFSLLESKPIHEDSYNNEGISTPTNPDIAFVLALDISRKLTDAEKGKIFQLEKRFVITGSLERSYENMGVKGELPDTYFSFACILLHLFEKYHDFNALNSAIRATDKACQLMIEAKHVVDRASALKTLNLEKKAINLLQEEYSYA